MGAAMRYVQRDEKTRWDDRQLISGFNCRPESVYDDFLQTKLLYHKEGGRMFYHMVQSFPKGEPVDPVTAHAAALKLAEYFTGREVLVCTHTDRDHIHSHFIINSVSMEDGKKLHISKPELAELRQLNDEICEEFHLPVFQPQEKKKVTSVSAAEYHVAAKGESWKFRLMNLIDECMRYARNRDEFILLMRSEGYDVRWQDTRKNITYTTPDGKKCRDDRLHDEKYLKENMENEFRIREELIAGGTAPAEYAATRTASGAASDSRRMGRAAGNTQRPVPPGSDAVRFSPGAEDTPPPGADVHTDEGGFCDAENAAREHPTGWEQERAALLTPTNQPAAAQLGVVDAPSDLGGLGSAVLQLGHHLESLGDVAPAYITPTHTDRKTRRKERELKIARGHAEDEDEEYQGPNLAYE
ncbi:MAG: relaxase/mobilization nuclease domain-containing protein [Oscillospiraceae bacterium]|nr:relaxase/mobilization nuclease domain-containing protein [Oscillospiraceae bacterium]